jgi:hypothetical protein
MAGLPLKGQSPPERIWKVNFTPGFSPGAMRELVEADSPLSLFKLTRIVRFAKMGRLKTPGSLHFNTQRSL